MSTANEVNSPSLSRVLYDDMIKPDNDSNQSTIITPDIVIEGETADTNSENACLKKHEYIQDLIEQLSESGEVIENNDSDKISSLSPEILASEELLTTMIENVQSRLSGLGKAKKKELRLNLQTLKSALVAERSQLRAARLDPLRYEDCDEDIEQKAEIQVYSPSPQTIKELLSSDSKLEYEESNSSNFLSLIKELPRASSPTSTCGATIGEDINSIVSPIPNPNSLVDGDGGLRERMARQLSLDDGTKIGPITGSGDYQNEILREVESIEKEAIKIGMTNLLSDKKFVAFAYCSWCFKQTVHGRVQRNLLRRSRYKCTECTQVTLKCRTSCGAMSRGHQDYDEELCARCDGTISEWGEERPCKMGYCSSCFHYSSHYLMHRGYVLHDTYRCSYCKSSTFLCATCHTDFGAFESNMVVISELLHYTCAKCGDQILSWEDPTPCGRKSSGSVESMSSSHRKQLLRYQHPFESFAEVRSHIACEALVDGKDFFDKSFSLINDATDSIFMSCWWLSPFIHLKRDSLPLKDEDRLCNLLWKKADEGIQIYVIIWNNSLFLSLCSEEAKEILEADHPNIHIMRDPAFSLPNFLWSHHQKFTCIDFTKAIVGGLDYAVGRYDTFNHELTDLGVPPSLKPKTPPPTSPSYRFTGPGLGNISPLNGSPNFSPNSNMTSPGSFLLPTAALDLDDSNENTESKPKIKYKVNQKLENLRGMAETLTYLELKKNNSKFEPNYVWLGLDYYQPQDSRPESYSEPTKDIVHRFSRCRMPWHDVSVAIEGLAAYDVAVNFIERWNHHRKSHTFEHLPKIGLPKAPALPPSGIAGRGRFTCEVQIIRSLGDWSGLQGRTTEASVYGAYMAAISKAQHYIYIENQYIVSSTAGGGVENRIIVAILDRIKDAIKNKRKFRVFIMFPIPEETGKPANHMLQLSYQTLFRGGLSLLDQFKLEFPDLDAFDYVGFYFLRTYGILPSGKEMSSNDNTQGDEEFEWKCVTDMVFVHSKIMLVDDEIAIIASNNLNDRSMLGNRDSELGAVVLDTKRVSMNMDNKKFTGRRFAHDLRVKLWREHLGLLNKVYDQHPWVQQLSQDPICDATYHGIFRKVAKLNTGIFKQIFPHIPSNSFNTFQEWEEFNLQVKNGKIKSPKNELLYKLNDLRGTLCFHPTRFCHSDSLDWSILEDIMGNELVS